MTRHIRIACVVAGLAAVPLLAAAAPAEDPAVAHARTLLRKAILIDGHNDLPWELRESKSASMDVDAFDVSRRAAGDTDIPRLREGEVGAQFWSVYVPGELKDGRFARVQLEQLDLARRIIAKYPNDLAFCLTADDIERAHGAGMIGSLPGMEGGHVLEDSLGTLRAYYDLGARYLTLTHNVTLAWADAAQDQPRHDGLTAFGREVVHEMNRLGMMVDLSHVSQQVMEDALAASEAPVIFSHSCTRALADHARNVPDAVLERLEENGGVIMVTFVPMFVSQEVAAWWAPLWAQVVADPSREAFEKAKAQRTKEAGPEPRATLAQVADHIAHVRKIAGIDHVGIGGDYPASAGAPIGLEDVSKYPYLFAELIRRGWSDKDLTKLAGGNLLRVMRQNETVAKRLQAARPPSKATIQSLDGGATGAKAVLDLENDWTTALVKGDQSAFRRLLADDFVYSENDRTMDRTSVLKELTSGAETIEAARNEGMELHDYGAAAAVTGWLVVKGHGPAGAFERRYRYTDTWMRRPGGWKIVIAHDFLVPTPPSITGAWQGLSTCVKDGASPECKDERILYHFKAAPDRPGVVVLDAEKIVEGKAVPMYTADFTYDPDRDAWESEFQGPRAHGLWSYVVRGGEMTGTLVDLPSRRLVRHVFARRS
jgi:membrane dipeptidase